MINNTIFPRRDTFEPQPQRRNRRNPQTGGGRRRSFHNHNSLLQLILKLIQLLRSQQQHQPQAKFRSFDGSGNNARHPQLGAANRPFRDLVGTNPNRELGSVQAQRLASPRAISNAVAKQTGSTENKKGLSDMFWLWGQFLDHDINLTPTDPNKPHDIKVPRGDPQFDSQGAGDKKIGFFRSLTTPNQQGSSLNNKITAYIDGSNIYGSSKQEADSLRSFSRGMLKEGVNRLLPTDNAGNFISGDVRVNEHAGLTAMHTLWMREHNRIAGQVANRRPHLSDENIFQLARKQVIGEMQAITYNEFIPKLIGRLPRYRGYNRHLSPQISKAFATTAYRLGHTMLSPTLLRLDKNGNEAPEGHLSLRNAFFKPANIRDHGIDSILRGFASQTAQAVDTKVVDDVRNFLFGAPGSGGFDLAALNIQRGRDHAMPSLNEARQSLGLRPITSFNDPIWQSDVGAKLAQVYNHPNEVDLWIGGLAEKANGNSLVGDTFKGILSDQFTRLRDADSHWYDNQSNFNHRKRRQLNRLTLSNVIKRNTGVNNISNNVLVNHTPPHFNINHFGNNAGAQGNISNQGIQGLRGNAAFN
ncbi:MAG: hypothetical protein KAH22_11610, partial [Thiotrichaceae bacterium]|nr:hypothetical protein [Thiotrichaceae bacterium]